MSRTMMSRRPRADVHADGGALPLQSTQAAAMPVSSTIAVAV
jgi:hypothetical protein